MKERQLEQDVLEQVRSRLAATSAIDDEQARDLIADEVFCHPDVNDYSLNEIKKIVDRVFCRTRKTLGILSPLVEDKDITEVMVNGADKIFVEMDGTIKRIPIVFESTQELEELIQNIASGVHREINELHPIVDARLADGSRVNGVYKNIAVNGPILTIRKFSDNYMRMEDLVGNGTLSNEAARLLEMLVVCGYNIFVSGGTSSGKTTLLNALSQFIPGSERVIVIEDSTELALGCIDNLVQMECRQENVSGKGKVTMAQLIRTSLRMRPDRIVVGEVRGEEVLDMLQAMNTGHAGSMSTGHGNSIHGMLRRLEAMYLMAMPLNIDAIRSQIAEGIDIMIHIERTGQKRRITEICELTGYQDGQFNLNPLMVLGDEDSLISTGNPIIETSKLKRKGESFFNGLRQSEFRF